MKYIPFVAVVALLSAACNNKTSTKSTTIIYENDALPPVETLSPNTNFKPAFVGQTRIGAVKTQADYKTKMLSDQLEKPWGITVLPDGRFLITQKKGTLRIATATGQLSEAITGLPDVNSDGQGGLLDIVPDPLFSENKMLYWTFSEKTSQGNLTSVAKGKLAADEKTIENAVVIYRATPGYKGNLHYGSRILFDTTGHLVFSTGERSDMETRPQAQDLKSGLGKIIRITTDGKPAKGNPFLNNPNARPELYSYGHRNVQGLALHPTTGDLWETEFGPKGGDEVNLIQPGKNYGWPTITYGYEYSGDKIGEAITQKDGMEQPIYYWDPVSSPSGITFYSGDAMAEWKNNLFMGGLNSQHIIRLVIENNKVIGEERLLESENQRFRDVAEGKDGALYTVTDSGRLYRIGK